MGWGKLERCWTTKERTTDQHKNKRERRERGVGGISERGEGGEK